MDWSSQWLGQRRAVALSRVRLRGGHGNRPEHVAARRYQIFPTLTDAQVSRLLPLGKRRAVKRGEILFDQGSTDVEFYVVLRGALEIVRPTLNDEEFVVLQAVGEFTGETNLLSGRRRQRAEAAHGPLESVGQVDGRFPPVLGGVLSLAVGGAIAPEALS